MKLFKWVQRYYPLACFRKFEAVKGLNVSEQRY